MSKRVLTIQSENCTGCHLCELACSSAKEGVFIPSQSRIRVVTNGLKGWSRPVVCVQCEDPMCLKACSVGAIYKTKTPQGELIVIVDKEKCTGCHQCVVACPFGAIEYLKKQKATKCDLCGGAPTCVDYCFYDCLQFIELSDEDYQKRSRKIKALTTKLCREIANREPHRRRVLLSVEDLLNKV
ncbi:hypothetical protein LCGC14_2003850 [marine sediment metagenome]|uniref:4Fe-4S ferredoxin-type domain-containing protein n=1 Tax=marine sediment metagenome TaxID=412755 RepID=A0A0F9F2G3_9ZZZZ